MRSAAALKGLGHIRVGLVGPVSPELTSCVDVLSRSADYLVICREITEPDNKTRRREKHGGSFPFSMVAEFAGHSEIDLVAVFENGKSASDSARQAILAGYDVYIQSPLSISKHVLLELCTLAERHGVRLIVKLNRRLAPANRFAADLVKEGYVGMLRSARLDLDGTCMAPHMATAKSVHAAIVLQAAECLDAFFAITGYPRSIMAVAAEQFVPEDAARGPLCLAGRLAGQGVFSIHVQNRIRSRSAAWIDLSGDAGELTLTNPQATASRHDRWHVAGSRDDTRVSRALAIPHAYARSSDGAMSARSRAIACIFSAFARDLHEGTSIAPTVEHAIELHRLIDFIIEASETGRTVMV